MTEYGL